MHAESRLGMAAIWPTGNKILWAIILGGAAVVTWIYQDYTAWVAFGTGGTPLTFRGYMRITKFRVLRALFGDSLKDTSTLASIGPSYLTFDLPRRQIPSPKILPRTLPQRQYPEDLDEKVKDRLHALPKKYATELPHLLVLDKSITEGRTTDAIYARPELPDRKQGGQDKVLGDEIAHVHPEERSVHVWLTIADAKKVVDARWGERIPLSSLNMTHNGWTFLYAPRSMAEVDVVEEIIKAGMGHLTGEWV